jgi:hypothetical protein
MLHEYDGSVEVARPTGRIPAYKEDIVGLDRRHWQDSHCWSRSRHGVYRASRGAAVSYDFLK